MMCVPGCSIGRLPLPPVLRLGRPSSLGGHPALYIHIALETEHRSAAAGVVLAAPSRRAWVTPAVLDMGGMRELTLLQNSVTGNCDLTGSEASCGF
jgi:hypothetical protein